MIPVQAGSNSGISSATSTRRRFFHVWCSGQVLIAKRIPVTSSPGRKTHEYGIILMSGQIEPAARAPAPAMVK